MLLLALLFALVNGVNDGGALVAAALKPVGLSPLTSVLVLAAAVAAVPVVVGTGVARTLTSGLVPDAGATTVVIGVLAATAVVAVLSWSGLPTSLTLAVVGGIVGAGTGLRLPVAWDRVGVVLVIAAAAPVVGAVLAAVGAPLLGLVTRGGSGPVRRAHRAAFAAQAVAYASNDGQKMIAVLAVAGAAGSPGMLAAVAAAFAVGALLGLPAATSTLSGGIAASGPREEVNAQAASSAAVLASAALGAPVSMTQSVAGALVGSGVRRGLRRVRWRLAARLGVAWIVTLPAATVAAGAAALLVRSS